MKSITINDRVYGKFEITEPVLIDLINSKPIQRLKKIGQQGLPPEYHYQATFTRYEHSIGVMLLLKKINADLDEQIVGLLHDVSHFAFSHVADVFYKTQMTDSIGDNILEKYLEKTEIPQILKKYNINIKKLYSKKYKLYDFEMPDLCADRLDYAFRQIYLTKNKKDATYLANNLLINKNELIFNSKKSAESFSKYFLMFQKEDWGHPENILRYHLIVDLLKDAINKKVIKEDDLKKDDYFVIDKIKESKDKDLIKKFNNLIKRLKFVFCENNYDYLLKNKFRYVDAKFIDKDNKIKKASEVNAKFKLDLEKTKQIHEKGYKVKLVN